MAATPPPIVGGEEAPAGRWPSVASVHYGGVPGCSGVLVHERVVLTAGHCAAESLDEVAIGGHDLERPGDFEWIDVERVEVHPDPWNTHDVAALLLARPAETAAASLALGCAAGWLVDGATAQIVGFGNTEPDGGGPTKRLHEAEVPIVLADCQDASRDCNVGYADLVAGGEGVDSCIGDSGGPLYLWGADGRPYLAATTSRAALPQTDTCGDGGVYVRLDGVAAWVEGVAEVELAVPDCGDFQNTPPTPEAFELELELGESVEVELRAEDPDEGQALSWSIGAAERVDAVVEGSGLRATARSAGEGTLRLLVDDGVDESALEVPVLVHPAPEPPVVEPEPRHGCAHATGGWLLGLLLLRGGWRRGGGRPRAPRPRPR